MSDMCTVIYDVVPQSYRNGKYAVIWLEYFGWKIFALMPGQSRDESGRATTHRSAPEATLGMQRRKP